MRRVGFTLIELLVVLAIIIMLVGILIPVLYRAKQQTQAVICTSNIKQLCVAFGVYEYSNEMFPHGFDDTKFGIVIPSGGYPGDPVYDNIGLWWFHFLDGVTNDRYGTDSYIWCPSRKVKDSGLKQNVLCGNYGVNRAICRDAEGVLASEFVGSPLKLSQIRHPSLTLLITDSGYSLMSWHGAISGSVQRFGNTRREGAFYLPGLSINKDRIISPGFEKDAIKGRHIFKTVNVGFTDGHADRVRTERLLVEEANGIYMNRSSLWMPK